MKKAAFITLMLAACVAFLALGIWQVKRLSWKNTLIAQTEAKLALPPAPAPAPTTWPSLTTADTYTRISLTGHYLPHNVFTLASTHYGRGSWVLTPFQTGSGAIVMVNRGFATSKTQNGLTPPTGTLTITGLLRLTEPHGSLLQTNKPSQNLWYSRDIPAIAHHLNLPTTTTAPYFLDLESSPNQPTTTQPIPGLTVTTFPNNHLQYALTWLALALLSLTGLIYLLRAGKYAGRYAGK